MRFQTLLLAFLASPFFFPVSCTTATLPAAHALAWADTRDLAGGDAPHLRLLVPVADRRADGGIVGIDAAELPARLAADPGLTPMLPASGAIVAEGDRLAWRVRTSAAAGQVIELDRVSESFTQTVRYRATDAGIVPLRSRVFSVGHAFTGLLIAAVSMSLLQRLLRWRFLPRAAPPAPTTRVLRVDTSGQFHTQCLAAGVWLGLAAMQGIALTAYTRGQSGWLAASPAFAAAAWHVVIAWTLWRGRCVPALRRFAPEWVLAAALAVIAWSVFTASR